MQLRVNVLSAVVLAVIAAAGACGSGPLAPQTGEPVPIQRLRAESASFTYNSGFTQAQQIVVRDQAAWEQVWRVTWERHSPQPPLPAIDFSREMVVVAALGARSTGGYSILIDSASSGANGITLRIRSISPGSGCIVTLAVTQPVDMARLPRRDGPVSFSERQEIQDCR